MTQWRLTSTVDKLLKARKWQNRKENRIGGMQESRLECGKSDGSMNLSLRLSCDEFSMSTRLVGRSVNRLIARTRFENRSLRLLSLNDHRTSLARGICPVRERGERRDLTVNRMLRVRQEERIQESSWLE